MKRKLRNSLFTVRHDNKWRKINYYTLTFNKCTIRIVGWTWKPQHWPFVTLHCKQSGGHSTRCNWQGWPCKLFMKHFLCLSLAFVCILGMYFCSNRFVCVSGGILGLSVLSASLLVPLSRCVQKWTWRFMYAKMDIFCYIKYNGINLVVVSIYSTPAFESSSKQCCQPNENEIVIFW